MQASSVCDQMSSCRESAKCRSFLSLDIITHIQSVEAQGCLGPAGQASQVDACRDWGTFRLFSDLCMTEGRQLGDTRSPQSGIMIRVPDRT